MWMLFCALCLLSWGLWGFFPKLAQRNFQHVEANPDIVSFNAAVYQVLGSALLFVPIAIAAVLLKKLFPSMFTKFASANLKLIWEMKGAQFAMLAGIGAALGGIFYQLAISRANVSVVVVVTALYPIITILLGWRLLAEQISLRQWAGIALALVAMALVAESPPEMKRKGRPAIVEIQRPPE